MLSNAVLSRILLLFAGHALCDYPLQGNFLAKGKNHRNPHPRARGRARGEHGDGC